MTAICVPAKRWRESSVHQQMNRRIKYVCIQLWNGNSFMWCHTKKSLKDNFITFKCVCTHVLHACGLTCCVCVDWLTAVCMWVYAREFRCPWRPEEVGLHMTVNWLAWVLAIKSGFFSTEPSVPHEWICCTPSKISQSPMTNTVWFHLCGILWGVKFMTSRMGTQWLEARVQFTRWAKSGDELHGHVTAVNPPPPSCTHQGARLTCIFISTKFWKKKNDCLQIIILLHPDGDYETKIVSSRSFCQGLCEGGYLFCFSKTQTSLCSICTACFCLPCLVNPLCQPSAHVFCCKLHSRHLESRRGKIPQ